MATTRPGTPMATTRPKTKSEQGKALVRSMQTPVPSSTTSRSVASASLTTTRPVTPMTTPMRNHSGEIDFVSNNGHKLELQTDGNLIIRSPSGSTSWSSFSGGKGTAPYKLDLRTGGNLSVTDTKNFVVWKSNSGNKGTAPYRAIVQDSGHLFIYDSKNALIWSSNAPAPTTPAPTTPTPYVEEFSVQVQEIGDWTW